VLRKVQPGCIAGLRVRILQVTNPRDRRDVPEHLKGITKPSREDAFTVIQQGIEISPEEVGPILGT